MYYEIVYDMLVNVKAIYYVHVCEQARWARSAGNSAIENYVLLLLRNGRRRKKEQKEARSPSTQSVRQEGNKSGSTVNDFSCALHLQRCFTSTKTVLSFRDGSPGRPPPLSHSSWSLRSSLLLQMLLYIHRDRADYWGLEPTSSIKCLQHYKRYFL